MEGKKIIRRMVCSPDIQFERSQKHNLTSPIFDGHTRQRRMSPQRPEHSEQLQIQSPELLETISPTNPCSTTNLKDGIMNPKIFPIIMITLQILAAICYAANNDPRRGVYWLAAAVLTTCVTY